MMPTEKDLVKIYLDGFTSDSLSFAEFFVKNAKAEDIIYSYDNSRLASAGYIVSKSGHLFGDDIIIPYLSALSTKKEFRGQGKIGNIIYEAFERLHSRGAAITFLNPFNPHYYKRYGYADITFIRKSAVEGGENYQIKKATKEDIPTLLKIEKAHSKQFDNYLASNRNSIQNLLASFSVDGVDCNLIMHGDCPLAFFFSHGDKVEYYAQVQEGIISKTEALKGKKYDQFLKNTLSANECEVYIQARIINVEKALLMYDYTSEINGIYTFAISDDFYKKNNREITIRVQKGKASLAECQTNSNIIKISISELCSNMFLGGSIFKKQNTLYKDKF